MKTVFRILNILALLTLAYFVYDLWQKSKVIESEQGVQKGFSAQQDNTDYEAILEKVKLLENRAFAYSSYSNFETRLNNVEEIILENFEEIV